MADLTRRAATLNDMKGIWTLVRQVAPDFPVDLATDAGQENILTEIMIGCSSELSPRAFLFYVDYTLASGASPLSCLG
jgi:hypothetical protein